MGWTDLKTLWRRRSTWWWEALLMIVAGIALGWFLTNRLPVMLGHLPLRQWGW